MFKIISYSFRNSKLPKIGTKLTKNNLNPKLNHLLTKNFTKSTFKNFVTNLNGSQVNNILIIGIFNH